MSKARDRFVVAALAAEHAKDSPELSGLTRKRLAKAAEKWLPRPDEDEQA